jgi:biopolymer transport protein ExbD
MAGVAIGGGGESRSHAKHKKKHKKKRIGIHIDMTPMVDIAFLLLTFFMLTTVFSKPQTMELNLPPDEKVTVEVAESSLLTLRIDKDGKIFWNMGTEPLQTLAFTDLRSTLIQRSQANPKLITLVKVDRDANYKMMVDIMDELNLANITRFSLAPMTDKDKQLMDKAATL